jgi:hypothetical protein
VRKLGWYLLGFAVWLGIAVLIFRLWVEVSK